MKSRASIIALAISLTVLVVVGFQLDWHGVMAAWARVVWPWVVAVAIVNIANSWVEGLRWRSVLGASDINVTPRTAFSAMLVGTVGNVVLPFKLGEAARAWGMARLTRAPMSTIASTVVLDRLLDVAALTLLLLVAPLVAGPIGMKFPSARVIAIGLAVTAVVLALLVLGWKRMQAHRGSGGRFTPQMDAFVKGLAMLRQHHILARGLALALASWFTRVAVVWLMFFAFGLDWSPLRGFLTLLAINLSIVVIGTPGNVGTFELAGAGALRLFGAPPEVAVSYAVALHLAEVVPTVLLGAFAIWKLGIRLERPEE